MTSSPLKNAPITQIGLVVRDIEATAQAWSAVLGIPVPEILITDPVEQSQTEYLRQSTSARAKLAFFNMGSIVIELIEPLGEPSTWNDQLVAHGPSLHHIAFEIKGMAEHLAELDAYGLPLIQRGEYQGGRYAYVDAVQQLGGVIELLEND